MSKRKIHENFSLGSERSRNFFYHTIVKKHFKSTENVYNNLLDLEFLKNIIQNNELYSPFKIECVNKDNKQLKVVKKHFLYLQKQLT
jgi:hypothetical protein